MTAALLAQVEFAPAGLSQSLFQPIFVGALIYVVLYIAGTVLENRNHPRGQTVSDLAFAVMILLALYTAVLAVIAVAQKYNQVIRMLEILAIVVVFFAILLVVLFALSQVIGLIARVTRRDRRVTADTE